MGDGFLGGDCAMWDKMAQVGALGWAGGTQGMKKEE
jgi:hypothetical protein